MKITKWIQGEEVWSRSFPKGRNAKMAMLEYSRRADKLDHFVEQGYDDERGWYVILDTGDNCMWFQDEEDQNISGILVEVYRCAGGDCSRNGVSAHANTCLLVLPEGGPFKVHAKWPTLVYDPRTDMSKRFGYPCGIVIPKRLVKSQKNVMFGGNFVYTSDSRFPSRAPLPIHDRVESF